MIKSIVQSGKYVQVSGGMTSGPYISPGTTGAGMMRWNANMNNIEINDGNSWLTLSTAIPSIGLTAEAESLLDWARVKRDEEYRIAALAAQHPTVADALEAVKKAQEQLQVVSILCETNER